MKQPRVTALVIARMTSSRLPGKGLMDISGKPLLWHIIARLRRVSCLDEIAIATTSQPEDQPLLDFAEMEKIKSFAYDGEVDDVLGRIVCAAECFQTDVVATISGDCPLVDPNFIELMVRGILASDCDAAGVDKSKYKCLHEGIGAMTLDAWRRIDRVSTEPYQREHAGIYVSENPGFLKKVNVTPEMVFQRDDFRISVDNLADLRFMRKVYQRLYRPGNIVDLKEVVHLMEDEPKIRQINAHIVQKDILRRSKRITFVLQVGEKIGLGHLRRCLALAHELHESRHCGVRFVLNQSEKAVRFLEERGFEAQTVDGSPFSAENLEQTLRHATSFRSDVVVLDSASEIPMELVLRFEEKQVKTVALDNLSEGGRHADLVVLPMAHLTDERKLQACRGKAIHGAPYVLLNREFVSARRRLSTSPKNMPEILVSIGGSDPNSVTAVVVEALSGLRDIAVTVVLGPFAAPSESLPALANLTALRDVSDMAKLLDRADLAVLGFGVTVYEAAHLGTPSLVIVHSEKDVAAARMVAQKGVCRSLGHWQSLDAVRIRNEVKGLLSDRRTLNRMGKSARELIDGRGVARVATEVLKISN